MQNRRGRPKFNPTQRQRDLVATCIAAGLSQRQIADALDLSLPVVCDRFRRELDTGRAKRIAENLSLLRRAALKNNVSAMRCLSALYADGANAPKLGKKAAATERAKTALIGSPWEDLIRRPQDGANGQADEAE